MSHSTDSFRLGDTVSYKYNGMTGKVAEIKENGSLVITFPSQYRQKDTLVVSLAASEVELVAGNNVSSSGLVSA